MRPRSSQQRMIVPIVLATVFVGGAVAIVLLPSGTPISAAQTGPELIKTPLSSVANSSPHYVGSGSCAARACHGSPTLSPGREWNSAYAIWAARDPHAQAYSVLFTPESMRMAAALGLGEASKAERCLACHSLPVAGAHAAAALNDAASLLSDGVGCEACHGPAGSYLAAHTMRGWREMGTARFDPKFGMKNTTDIAARAQVCAGCHVGQPDADGWPWRDVNHDLIAAGHPRLSFEFSAYMAMLPPHWNTKVNKDRFDELYSWLVGQLTTADAALRLLQCRAKSAGSAADLKDHKENSLVPSAWPELSEYDCYACHHGLAGQRWRQELAAPNRAASKFDRPARKSGAPAWGTWYYDGPRVIAQSELYLKAGKSTEFIDELNNLTASMQKPLPLVDEVLVQASQCARLIPEMQQASAIIAISRPPRTDANRIRQDILKSLAEQFERHRPESWDEFVQAYLAVVAMHRSEVNSTAQNAMNAERHRQIDELLQAIRNRLSFPSEASAPGAQLPSAKLRVLQSGINSPEQFDPDLRPAANSGVPGADKNLFELFDEAFRLLSAEATS